MNYLIKIILVLTFLAGCRTEVNKVPCVGLNGKKVPGVEYEYSAQNIIAGIIFIELIIPPVIVVLEGLECPVEAKKN